MFTTFFLGTECRIGEAKTPGPSEAQSDCHWSLGVCNPSGLQGKSVLLAGIQADVISVSETHLTTVSRSMLAASLKSHSAYEYVVTGAPLAPRVNSSDAGQYSGVATVAKVPTRALCAPWPPDLYETGRAQIVASLVNNVWITGATLYGYPQSKTHHKALEKTILALDFLVEHMTKVAVGPRYLAGDWNHEMHALPATATLQALGWVEAQDLEFLHSGVQPRVTCKCSTRKDMLWLSPELAATFLGLTLDPNRFADHAVLVAKFHAGKEYAMRYLWPTPKPIPWKDVPALPEPLDFVNGSPTQCFQALWTAKESQAQLALGDKWEPQMQGRGQQTTPKPRRGWAAPVKKGRSHDAQPLFHGCHVQHARWIRQLRRLQNYHRWALNHFGQTTQQSALHGLFLWKSILTASGFRPSFAEWWLHRWCVGFGDPAVIPLSPPPAHVALTLCEAFQCEVRSFEQHLNTAVKTAKVNSHKRDTNLVFKDTKRPLPETVTSLLHACSAKVTHVDSQNVAVEFEPPGPFDEARPVCIDGIPTSVIHATEDKLFLDDLHGALPGAKIEQSKPVGALEDIFTAFHEQWQRRWCKHDEVPHSHWQQLVDFARAHVPHHPVALTAITPALLRAEVAAKKPHAATGLDGVSRLDLLLADDAVLQSFCSMYQRAELDGSWPVQTTTGRVASLAKREQAATTNDYRPITVFSLLYRAYSGVHARALLHWCDEWAHPDIHGNRRQHQTAHLWRVLVSSIQHAHDCNLPLSGLTADIEKCFNCLPRWPILATAVHAGAPQSVLQAWAGALASMTRCFKVRDSYSPGFTTSTGLAEGCALSCFGMLLLDDVMHRYIAAQFPTLRVLSFVDNWDFLTWDPNAACHQLDALLQFTQLADLTVDKKKTFAWSTDAKVRQALRQSGLPVLQHTKDLGAHIGFTKQHTNKTLVDRMSDLDQLWPQLKRSKAGYKTKVRALRAVAWPRGLFAIESALVGQNHWLTLRRKAVQALQFDKPGVNPILLLGLVESYVDPEFVGIVKTVAESRLQCPLDFWASDVAPVALGHHDSPMSSPAMIVLERIQSIGIAVHPDGR